MKLLRRRRPPRGGFTLAEVAVTIAIVGLILVFVLQGINEAKLLAAHTRNQRIARELALGTLAGMESGLFVDDMNDERLEGTYADDGYPDFTFEAVLGERNFRQDTRAGGGFDNWNTDEELDKREQEEEEGTEQPYERVQIKVVFPRIGEDEDKNQLIFEKWIPWKQVHPDEEGSTSDAAAPTGGGTQ
ncbi:MAG: prepilin-type N-terminal cleavage/methylation domain-containing protein [Planctomycetes bacterium]|nr:prepilin-type N-terminal cleavage/methylation domain-containing protein [Planctomycetota bacterium]